MKIVYVVNYSISYRETYINIRRLDKWGYISFALYYKRIGSWPAYNIEEDDK